MYISKVAPYIEISLQYPMVIPSGGAVSKPRNGMPGLSLLFMNEKKTIVC